MSEIKLPPMPEPSILGSSRFGSLFKGYVAMHMQNYARAAIELDRQGRGEPLPWHEAICHAKNDALHVFADSCDHTQEAIEYMAAAMEAITTKQPAEPTVKDSLTVAEPVKVPSEDTEVVRIAGVRMVVNKFPPAAKQAQQDAEKVNAQPVDETNPATSLGREIGREFAAALKSCMPAKPDPAMAEDDLPWPWRVGLFWSSSSPGTQVRVLADGHVDIERMAKHPSFIKWVSVQSASGGMHEA